MENFKQFLRFVIALGALFGVVYVCETASAQEAWNPAFEADPADADPVSEGDDNIRDTRTETRNRSETDLCFGTNDDDGCAGAGSATDSGRLREGGARCFVAPTAPTSLGDHDGSGTPEVFDYDNTGGGGSSALDAGRCWLDSNDGGSFHIYDGTAWRQQTKTSGNLIYGGSFEQTDGTGDVSVTTVPAGWALGNTPTIAYTAPPNSEGGGVEITVTAGAAETDEGITQTLTGAGGLKPSTNYVLVGRTQPQVALDSCTLRTTGASADITLTQSTGTAYVTLAGYFATDATPTAITITAEADGNSDACSFDHIAVFELGNLGQYQPGILAFQETANTGQGCDDVYTGLCTNVVSVTVEPPGPGYIAYITGQINMQCGSNDQGSSRIFDGTNTIGEAFLMGVTVGDEATMALSGVTTTPLTPGTAVTYQLDAREDTGDTCAVGPGPGAVGDAHQINVLLIPTR